MKKIAILGATGHIAKGLLFGWNSPALELQAYARSRQPLDQFLQEYQLGGRVTAHTLDSFGNDDYAAVINCIGIGNPLRLAEHPADIFQLTETYDNLILDYLTRHPAAHYVNLSSGAVYGTNFPSPAGDHTPNAVPVNDLTPSHFYGLAKLCAEAKHRARPGHNIIDLRIFGYFSRFTDLGKTYFLNDILGCLLEKMPFITGAGHFLRDFLHFQDLAACLDRCLAQPRINAALDLYSLKPVSKSEILAFFQQEYGLQIVRDEKADIASPTGGKAQYYSLSRKAQQLLGYQPAFSSLDCIREEAGFLLKNRRA